VDIQPKLDERTVVASMLIEAIVVWLAAGVLAKRITS
jgi:hypothetical protein